MLDLGARLCGRHLRSLEAEASTLLAVAIDPHRKVQTPIGRGCPWPAGLLLNSNSTKLQLHSPWIYPWNLEWSRGHWEALE
jgi:hypothetical protein